MQCDVIKLKIFFNNDIKNDNDDDNCNNISHCKHNAMIHTSLNNNLNLF